MQPPGRFPGTLRGMQPSCGHSQTPITPTTVRRRVRLAAGATWRVAAPLTALSLLFVAANMGCEPSPRAERQVRMRTDNMARTLGGLASSEASRPARLQTSLDFIPSALARDANKLQRSGDYAKFWWDRQLQRFQERQPVYRDEAGRILWGKPQRIEHDAIIMFF